jgi:hypothetical protein
MPPVPVVIPLYIAEEGEESELAHTSPRTGFSFPAICACSVCFLAMCFFFFSPFLIGIAPYGK